jgi:uncharacterized protein (TIGR03086 family)
MLDTAMEAEYTLEHALVSREAPMEDWTDVLTRTYELVRAPVVLLQDTLLERPTPCSQWSVRDLVEHTLATIDRFAAAAGASSGATCTDGGTEGTLVERFDAAVARNIAAWRSRTDWSATLTVPFGEFPAEVAVGINQLDSLIHSWDIGSSLGLPVALPDDLSEVAMQMARVRVPLGRGRVFGAEVPARGSSPGEKLLAFTGRDTAAWPGAIWVAGSLVTVKPGADAAPASAVEIWEREDSGPPRHVHSEQDEIWYVLEGRFTFAVGERDFEAGPGSFVVGPRGVPHTFRAQEPRSRLLDIHIPGGFERFFVQAGIPATALVPPPAVAVDGSTSLRAAIEAFGATVVGPPLGS